MSEYTRLERFFVFAYFGIDLNDENSDEDIIRKCVERAYLDMCRTLKIDDQEWIETKENLSKDLVNVLLNNKSIQDKILNAYSVFFENDSEQLTESQIRGLVDKNGDGICFYYGQAQKWINMSLKYMWLLGLIDEKDISKLEVPIDSYIYKAAKIENGKKIIEESAITGLGVKPIKRTKLKNNKKTNEEVAWSRINKGEYETYQANIRKALGQNMSPIEWEFDAWIAQAKIEKQKENNKNNNDN